MEPLTVRLDTSPPTHPCREFSWHHPAVRKFPCSNKDGCSGLIELKVRVLPDIERGEILTKSVQVNLHCRLLVVKLYF